MTYAEKAEVLKRCPNCKGTYSWQTHKRYCR